MPTTPLAPFEPYGESKAAAEAVVAEARRNGQTVASLRPRTLLGEGRLGIFDVIFARVRAGKRVPMFGAGRNKVQMSDVEDFCSAALKAIEKQRQRRLQRRRGRFTARSGRTSHALIDHAGTSGCDRPPSPLRRSGPSSSRSTPSAGPPSTSGTGSPRPSPSTSTLRKTKRDLGWRPRYSNAQALIRAYKHYLARPEASSASAHRSPLEGGLAKVLRG